MGAYKITSRQIIGMILGALEDAPGLDWVGQSSMFFNSDQAQEEYAWLGLAPVMREWIGGRNAKGLRENSYIVKNKKFEATLEILCDWLRRDKTGQVRIAIQQLAERGNSHWASLLSALIIAGESATCYDGQYFFDTDHSEGASGSQSNRLTITLSALPISSDYRGTTTAPSPETIQAAILKCIEAILGFKDDQGEPMNDGARAFSVMVPVPFMSATIAAINNPTLSLGKSNTILSLPDFRITPVVNPRLTWTTKLMVFRTDGATKAFIRQQEEDVSVSAIAEGSELEFKEDKHNYGIMSIRNVAYGFWQKACLATLA